MIDNKLNFIKNYFDKEDNFFITMINHSNGQTRNYFHNIFSFEKYINRIEELNKDNSIYFSFNAFKPFEDCYTNEKGFVTKTKGNVGKIKAMIFDFDDTNVSNERKDYLIKTLGIEPTYVLETSPNKFQVCYKLFESNIPKDKFEIVSKAFATYFGSDINVCSIEKLFRMPFSINKKNDFETKLLSCNFDNVYELKENFLNYIANNEDIKNIFYQISHKNKEQKLVVEQQQEVSKNKKNVNPIFDMPLSLDNKLVGKYGYFLKHTNYDASVSDLKYIYARLKQDNSIDFDTIFGEIKFCRYKIFNKPFKREEVGYYNDRQDKFEEYKIKLDISSNDLNGL